MPRLLDHKQEINKTYTPLEKTRRDNMNLRDVKYGFFRVAKRPLDALLCDKCDKDITHKDHVKVNGVPLCWECKLGS